MTTPKQVYEDYQIATDGLSFAGAPSAPFDEVDRIDVIEGCYCVAVGAALRAGLSLPPPDPRVAPERAAYLVNEIARRVASDPVPEPPRT